jgi:hypothetical protein
VVNLVESFGLPESFNLNLNEAAVSSYMRFYRRCSGLRLSSQRSLHARPALLQSRTFGLL